MKVSGFTIVRNGLKYFYPFVEAINSILPLCDEFIVNVGDSDDNTFEAVQNINSDKIKIFRRQWDMSLREEGKVLSVETNFAMKQCSGDWLFYIQADELLHEKYFEVVKKEMKENFSNENIEGLQFRYKHFYGSYDYVQDNYRNWYVKETRIVKNRSNIISWGDAMGFRHPDGSDLKVKKIKADIYHYGWVKPPEKMSLKRVDFHKLYFTDFEAEQFASSMVTYDDLGNLKKFEGTHPAVLKERIKAANFHFDAQIEKQKPVWIRKILIFLHPVLKRIKRLRRSGKNNPVK
jgi:glycosyltransferase involved in cell wall biosynthesis